MSHGRAPAIAIGAALAALAVSVIAVIATRRDEPEPAMITTRVPAERIAELRREAVRMVNQDGLVGARIADEPLRRALGLAASDVITHVAGRPLVREVDLATAMVSASGLDAAIVYAEIVRDGRPLLVRWEVAGDLRRARLGVARERKPVDPLIATVEKLDELRYAVPRSTIERVLANPTDFARSAVFAPVASGVALSAVRTDSLFAAVGLRSGDIVRAINGHALSGLDDMLDVYVKVRDSRELAIDITRHGAYELITIVIK